MPNAKTHKFLDNQFKPFAHKDDILGIQLKKGPKGLSLFVASFIIFSACFVAVDPFLRAERVTITIAVMAPATAMATPDNTNKSHRLNVSNLTKSLTFKFSSSIRVFLHNFLRSSEYSSS